MTSRDGKQRATMVPPRRLGMEPSLFSMYREFSAGVCKSEAATLRNPVMPVADGLSGRFVWTDGGELSERDC